LRSYIGGVFMYFVGERNQVLDVIAHQTTEKELIQLPSGDWAVVLEEGNKYASFAQGRMVEKVVD
jgi:hypothetical protein